MKDIILFLKQMDKTEMARRVSELVEEYGELEKSLRYALERQRIAERCFLDANRPWYEFWR